MIEVGSPGWSSGRKSGGMMKVFSCSVVLSISDTVPVALNRAPRSGRPMPPPAETVMEPATPTSPLSTSVLTKRIAVAAPKVSRALPLPIETSPVRYMTRLGVGRPEIAMKIPPCSRNSSVVVPGMLRMSWPTRATPKLNGCRVNDRVRSDPPSPRPLRTSVSFLTWPVVLICRVPLANMLIPRGCSAEKFVSRVATPQNCGAELDGSPMSRTNRPEVAPTVPSLMIDI